MKKNDLISIIISTKNEEANIENCLKSIKEQSYKEVEVIVVDNYSTDRTVAITKTYTKNVFERGPERSSQRNFGAEKAKGRYLLFLDADMILTPNVLEECITLCQKSHVGGIIIPELSDGETFWAKCKQLEKSFYLGVQWIEAARFFDKEMFRKVGGYNTTLISGEDWNLHQRVRSETSIGRINAFIIHNEGNLTLAETVKKKYYYARHISQYQTASQPSDFKDQSNILKRYRLFLSQPKKLFSNPILGGGMLFMKAAEFFGGGVGYLIK